VGLDDGSLHDTPVPLGREGAVLDAIGRLVPHATLGFDAAAKARFHAAGVGVAVSPCAS
jgi:hypothetical protein